MKKLSLKDLKEISKEMNKKSKLIEIKGGMGGNQVIDSEDA